MSINNDRAIILHTRVVMDKKEARWAPYTEALTAWFPAARIVPARAVENQWDAVVHVGRGPKALKWVANVRPHLPYQDIGVVAARLRLAARAVPGARTLVFAPYVRREQGRVLQEADIDYVDLVGNVHVDVPERFVHVEGKRPIQTGTPVGRLTRGWVKTVMAILVQPELLVQPYRTLALNADVATGTVIACLKHLRANRFLVVRGAERRLRAVPDLIAQWVATYADLLRPRLAERRFQVPATAKADIWAALGTTLGDRGIRWALTGADAAEIAVGHYHAENTEVYAPVTAFDDRQLLLALPAQPAIRGNLLVIDPPGPLAVTTTDNAVPTAPLLLQYAELQFRGTGQAREAADLLLPKLLEHAEP